MTARVDTGEPFLQHLNVSKTPYIFLTAETDDFDEDIIAAWQEEGFVTTYVPYGDGGRDYINRMHAAPDQAVGLNDQYAIVGSFFPPLAWTVEIANVLQLLVMQRVYASRPMSSLHPV